MTLSRSNIPQKRKALFLDRDGVVNHDPGDYTKSLEEFEILPTIIQKMKTWYDAGYLIIIITNQGGIAKELYPLEEVDAIHQYLQGRCIAAGFEITDFYYCPHHPDLSGKCFCRKPGSLLIEKAIHRYQIDPNLSVMFGDRERDVQCANGAGVKGIQIETNSEILSVEEFELRNLSPLNIE
jgi:D-glycero-D-manno-heptose 1,7-bisphosphate phosphatase